MLFNGLLRFGYNSRGFGPFWQRIRRHWRILWEHLIVLPLCGALAVLFTYPLILGLDRIYGVGDSDAMVWIMS